MAWKQAPGTWYGPCWLRGRLLDLEPERGIGKFGSFEVRWWVPACSTVLLNVCINFPLISEDTGSHFSSLVLEFSLLDLGLLCYFRRAVGKAWKSCHKLRLRSRQTSAKKAAHPVWPAAPTPECFIKLFQMPNNCMCYRVHFFVGGWLCLVRCGFFLPYSCSLESWELTCFPESLYAFSCIVF